MDPVRNPIRILMVAAIAIAHAGSAAFADGPVENIRPRDPIAILLLQIGMERSQTFRQLGLDLRQSNVIVYVDVRHVPGYGPTFHFDPS